MKRTTVVLSDEMYEHLRSEAFQRRISLSRLIRVKLEPKPARRKRRDQETDPLMRIAGIGSDGHLTEGIDEALYGDD